MRWLPSCLALVCAWFAIGEGRAVAQSAEPAIVYWFSDAESWKQLPEVTVSDRRSPAELATALGGRLETPSQAGRYIVYVHERLWYWFGPLDADEAGPAFQALTSRLAALRALNSERYDGARVVEINASTAQALTRVFMVNPSAFRFADVLSTLDQLRVVQIVEAELKRLESAGLSDDQKAAILTRTDRAVAYLTLAAEGRSLPDVAIANTIDPLQSYLGMQGVSDLMQALGWQSVSSAFGADKARLFSDIGANPAEAGAVAKLATQRLEEIGVPQRRARQAVSELERVGHSSGLAPGAQISRGVADVGSAILEEAARQAGLSPAAVYPIMMKEDAEKIAKAIGRIAGSEAEGLVRRAIDNMKPGTADKPSAPGSLEEIVGTVVGNLEPGGPRDEGASQLVADARDSRIDLVGAAITGLNKRAADALLDSVAKRAEREARKEAAQTDGANPQSMDSISAQAALNALTKIGVSSSAHDLLKKVALSGATGKGEIDNFFEVAGRAYAGDAAQAAEKRVVADQAEDSDTDARPNGEPMDQQTREGSKEQGKPIWPLKVGPKDRDESMSPAKVQQLFSIIGEDATEKNWSPPSDDAGRGDPTKGESSADKGEASSESQSGDKTGKPVGKTDGGPEREGALDAASVPAFELILRAILRYYDAEGKLEAYARQALALMYMANPELFNQLADQVKDLHDEVVSKPDADNIDQINRVLDKLQALANTLQIVQGDIQKFVDQDVDKMFDRLTEMGIEALTDEGIKKLQQEIPGLDPDVVRGLMGSAKNFDANKAVGVATEFAKKRVTEELIRRQMPQSLAECAWDRSQACLDSALVAAPRQLAVGALKQGGVSAQDAEDFASGNVDAVYDRHRTKAQKSISSLRSKLSSGELNGLASSEVEKAAKRAGAPADLVKRLRRIGDRPTPDEINTALDAFVRGETKRTLTRLGASPKTLEAVLKGDTQALATAAEEEARAAAANELGARGFDQRAASLVATGDGKEFINYLQKQKPKRALELLKGAGASPLVRDAAAKGDWDTVSVFLGDRLQGLAAQRLAADSSAAEGEIQAMMDPQWLRRQVDQELERANPLVADAMRVDNQVSLGDFNPETIRELVFEMVEGQNMSWDQAAAAFGMVTQEGKPMGKALQTFAQSTDSLQDVKKAVQEVAGAMTGETANIIERQEFQLKLQRQKIEAKLEKSLPR